jgi:hypothetical protein
MSEYTKLSSAYIKEDFVNNQEIRSAVDPSYCLTFTDDKLNAEASLSKCNNSPSQKFTYQSDTEIKVSNMDNKCLAKYKDVNDNRLVLWSCDPNFPNERSWTYSPSTNTIKNNFNNVFLELSSPSTISFNKTESSSPSQKWFGSNDCVITPTPSDLSFSPCDATQCGTTGSRQRRKYNVVTPSAGLGSCPSEFVMESTPCSAAPCPSVNCTLSPSNADWGECSATQCGTKGTRQRNKYNVDSPSMYGGSCPSEFVMESTPCSAVPCPVNCTLSPSNALFSPCSATQCGTKGTRARPKYKVKKPSMYDGACDDEFEEEEEACSAPDCATPSTTDENKKMYIIIGVVVSVLFLLIVVALLLK